VDARKKSVAVIHQGVHHLRAHQPGASHDDDLHLDPFQVLTECIVQRFL
jgi:hypothetical protein